MFPIDTNPTLGSHITHKISVTLETATYASSVKNTFPYQRDFEGGSTLDAYSNYKEPATAITLSEDQTQTILNDSSAGTKIYILTQEDKRNMELLNSSYNKEANRTKSKFSQKKIEQIESAFSPILIYLGKLPFQKCAIDFNENNTIKISLSFNEGRLLMLTKNISNVKPSLKSEITYTYFINSKLIASDVIDFHDFITRFKKYITA